MKYKLINQVTKEEHLCDKITIDGFDYYVSDEIIKDVRPYYGKWQVEEGTILNKFPTYLTDLSSCRLIIATNNPNIDIPKVVDVVERLSNILFEDHSKNIMSPQFETRKMFILGYNKSQETHPFSEEDMIEFGDWLNKNASRNNAGSWGYFINPFYTKTTKELFEIWKEQRIKTLYYK